MSKSRKKTAAARSGSKPKDRQGSHDSAPDDDDEQQQAYRGPGRPRGPTIIEDYWTRVLSPCYRQIDHAQKYDINKDLANELEALEEIDPFQDNISWPIFQPDDWAKDYVGLKTEDWKLSEDKLREYAGEITALRTEVLEKAIRKEAPNVDPRQRSEDDRVQQLALVNRRYTK